MNKIYFKKHSKNQLFIWHIKIIVRKCDINPHFITLHTLIQHTDQVIRAFCIMRTFDLRNFKGNFLLIVRILCKEDGR